MAGSLGYCGLDRRRQPLAGDEIRSCWEAWPGGADPMPTAPPSMRPAADDESVPARAVRLEFVEVGDRPEAGPADAPMDPAATSDAPSPLGPGPHLPSRDGEPGWSLWGDLDR